MTQLYVLCAKIIIRISHLLFWRLRQKFQFYFFAMFLIMMSEKNEVYTSVTSTFV